MEKTYIINKETSRLELKFSKEEYQALDGSTKAEIKSIFLFSGKAQAWVSRTKSGHYRAITFAERLGFINGGSVGETLTIEEVAENKAEKQEYRENGVFPIIDINDIETYLISENLSRSDNDNSMFRINPINHQKELQELLLSANNDVIELINLGCGNYIEYKAKTILQSFKKHYTEQSVKVLTHKGNNPSWMVTGRGNMNISRYNKKQEQLSNMNNALCILVDEFNSKMKSFKNQIKKVAQDKLKIEIEETLKTVNEVIFTKIVKEYNPGAVENIFSNPTSEIKGYSYNEEYFLFKNWGYWRIYNKLGNELNVTTRIIKTLKEAKTHLSYIVNNVA